MSPSHLLGSVERLRSGLDYHLTRHNLLVSNLAQAETPSYQPVDLVRSDQFAKELHVAMSTTQRGHLGGASVSTSGAPSGSNGNFRVVADGNVRSGNDGNGVDIDREAVKIASNQIRYDMIAQLASAELATLSWAASDGRGG